MIKIAFTGDIMLSRCVGEASKKRGLITAEVRNELQKYDFVVGNLECPVVVDAKVVHANGFKAHPDSLKQISDFDLLTLANNHIFDCGKPGARETLFFVEEYGYKACGLKESKAEITPFVKDIKGRKVGFVAAATRACMKNENDHFPHLIDAEDGDFLFQVKKMGQQVNHLFVLVHGGNEMIAYPEPSFRNLCENLIDSGASCVITHHPHILGGKEIYNGKPIIYSLGDFIFDGQSYKRRRGAILDISIQNNDIEFKIIPTQITDSLQVIFSDEMNSKLIVKKWNKVSKKLLSDGYDQKYRKLYLAEMFRFQADRLRFLFKQEGIKSVFKFIFKKMNLLGYYTNRILKGKIK